MRQKTALIPTLREVGEAEMVSHRLMLRAGMIRQLAAGVYTYLPLAYRVLRKVENIVRQEMDRAGAQELLLPALQPAELWEETKRFDTYGPELVKLQDRHGRPFVIGPTHEEVITDLLRGEINSYKRLPMILYQIQTKVRDERRPRSGLLRGREFIMKDAYSFDLDRAGLEQSYKAMYQAYERIFTRCGVKFRAVEADAGSIGGKGTHEFMVMSESGEDTIALCTSCDYAANLEMAEVVYSETPQSVTGEGGTPEKVSTPNAGRLEEVAQMLGVTPQQVIKSLLFVADEEPVLVLVRGDHEVNEIKVKNLLGASVCELADEETVHEVTGAPVGFAGPIGLKKKVQILADNGIRGMTEAVVGANEKDYHLVGVTTDLHFHVDRYGDLRNAEEGDPCPKCGAAIRFSRGIEVGHVFKLGTEYSEKMGATFLDQQGKVQPYIMGCYGIGVSRTVAAIIEQHHDEAGIIWPLAVAPFAIHLIAVNMKNKEQAQLAEELYTNLISAGYEVLFDDREERAGVKFKDADLIGIPLRITVGSKAAEGLIEYKFRRGGESGMLPAADLLDQLPNLLERV